MRIITVAVADISVPITLIKKFEKNKNNACFFAIIMIYYYVHDSKMGGESYA